MSVELASKKASPSPAALAAKHLAEARQAAEEQIRLLVSEMAVLRGVAREIAVGGPIYPAGVREMSDRFVAELEAKAKSISSVMQWPSPGPTAG